MPRMTTSEMAEFLGEPGHLLRLGTVDAEGVPLVVPIWFEHVEGRLVFTPRERSAWLAHLKERPQVCCTVDESQGEMRKVVARGTATCLFGPGEDDEWRDRYRSITERYVPPRFADAYLTDTHDEPRELWALPLAEAEVRTWRMPARAGEDRLAVWAPSYYHDTRG